MAVKQQINLYHGLWGLVCLDFDYILDTPLYLTATNMVKFGIVAQLVYERHMNNSALALVQIIIRCEK